MKEGAKAPEESAVAVRAAPVAYLVASTAAVAVAVAEVAAVAAVVEGVGGVEAATRRLETAHVVVAWAARGLAQGVTVEGVAARAAG